MKKRKNFISVLVIAGMMLMHYLRLQEKLELVLPCGWSVKRPEVWSNDDG